MVYATLTSPSPQSPSKYSQPVREGLNPDSSHQAHLYEYTTQLSVDPNLKFKGLEKGIMPVGRLPFPPCHLLHH